MPSYSLLVDSSKRTSGTPTSFTFQFQNGAFPEIHSAQLNWVQIPLAVYNVQSGSTVHFTENATTKVESLTAGQWNATQLQTALNAASAGYNNYTVVYDSNTYLYTISATQFSF